MKASSVCTTLVNAKEKCTDNIEVSGLGQCNQ